MTQKAKETIHVFRCERETHELALTDNGKPQSKMFAAALEHARNTVAGLCKVKLRNGRTCGRVVRYFTEVNR